MSIQALSVCVLLVSAMAAPAWAQDTSELVNVDLTVRDVDDSAFNGAATFYLRHSKGGYLQAVEFSSVAAGLAQWRGEIDSVYVNESQGVTAELFTGHESVYLSPDRRYYANAADGVAAFESKVHFVLDPATGEYSVSIAFFLSAPPAFGSLVVSNSAPTGEATIDLHDLNANSLQTQRMKSVKSALIHELGVPLAQGVQTIDVFSWSSGTAARVLITSSSGVELNSGVLRRNSYNVGISATAPKVSTVRVTQAVSQAAYAITVVRPADHQPDPSTPTGSAIDYRRQRQRSLASFKIGVRSPDFEKEIFSGTRDLVVEVWERISQPGPDVYILVHAYGFTAQEVGGELTLD